MSQQPPLHHKLLADYRDRLTKGETPEPLRLFKQYHTDVKAIDGEDLSLEIRISTKGRDRDRDTVDPAGWQLANYRKNPVVLFGHNYQSLPVARDEGIAADELGLVAHPRFTPQDLNAFGYTVYRMLREKFLNAASVGFIPMEWTYNEAEGGVDMKVQELLEFSIVPVPANPECLVEARGMGIDLLPLKAWAENVLDTYHQEAGIWLPRKSIERALKLVGGEPVSIVVPETPTPKADEPAATDRATETSASGEPAASESEPIPADAPAPTEPTVERGTVEPEGLVFELAEPEPDVIELVDDAPGSDKGVAVFEIDEAVLRDAIQASVANAVGARMTALTGRLD